MKGPNLHTEKDVVVVIVHVSAPELAGPSGTPPVNAARTREHVS